MFSQNRLYVFCLFSVSDSEVNYGDRNLHLPLEFPVPWFSPGHSQGEIWPIHVPCTIHACDQVSPGIEVSF